MKIIISDHLRIRNYDIPVKLLRRQCKIEFFCFPTHALLSSQPYPTLSGSVPFYLIGPLDTPNASHRWRVQVRQNVQVYAENSLRRPLVGYSVLREMRRTE